MPVNVTLSERTGALWWGAVMVAPAGATGRLPAEARQALVAAGLVKTRMPAGHLHVHPCARCAAAILAHPVAKYCRPCALVVRRQQIAESLRRRRGRG